MMGLPLNFCVLDTLALDHYFIEYGQLFFATPKLQSQLVQLSLQVNPRKFLSLPASGPP